MRAIPAVGADRHPEAMSKALATHGAEALPDPPLEFPAWLADLRAHWAEETPAGGSTPHAGAIDEESDE